MSTIELNNQNKTKFNFSYDHGLTYKKAIRPDIEYGDWEEDSKKTLIKFYLSDNDMSLINNKNKILINNLHAIRNELWFDLEDIYIVMALDGHLEKRIDEKNILLAFLHNNKLINSVKLK